MKKKNLDLDLTKVIAPCIFMREVSEITPDNKIYKYDLRFTQPNEEFIDAEALSLLSFWLKKMLNKYLADMINFSPLSSGTGFSLLILNNSSCEEIAYALSKALIEIVNTKKTHKEVDKSLIVAKEHATKMLNKMNNWLKGAKE